MIILKLQEGLGNQLFQWAYGYTLSKDYDVYFDLTFYNIQNIMSPVAIRSYELSKLIKAPIPFVNASVLSELYSMGATIVSDDFHYKNLEFDKNKNFYLNGYWQSEKFFERYKEEILSFFKWPEVKNYDFENSCSIHIRRGDYLNLQHVHPIQTLDYYEKALEVVNPQGNVFIFSDDIDWCEQNLKFKNQIFMKGNSNIEDLRYMSLCTNNIIANSSFSWWGAYLNQNLSKTVVCPKKWFGDSTYDKDLKLHNWVEI